MIRLVLGNQDYAGGFNGSRGHMTNEGLQLQDSLVHAGWQIAGRRLAIDEVDVPTILSQVKPDIIFIQDVRDWDERSGGCFDKSVGFKRWECLKHHPALKVMVFKDAAVAVDYQHEMARLLGVRLLKTYYHAESIKITAPWASDYPQIQEHHTIDSRFIRSIECGQPRRRACITGHTHEFFYPLRNAIAKRAPQWGIEVRPHPGWNNKGCDVENYLRYLMQFKVSIATATRFGHSLRKIIESVACGCMTVTNLPRHDVLPEIDEALVRIPLNATMEEAPAAVDQAVELWDEERTRHYAEKALDWYDWRTSGVRLSQRIEAASRSLNGNLQPV